LAKFSLAAYKSFGNYFNSSRLDVVSLHHKRKIFHNDKRNMKFIVNIILLLVPFLGFSQQPDTTKTSIPKMAELKIDKAIFRIFYYAPSVRGRVIYGGLVPFDQVWVTGAHRATALEFNVPVSIEGKELKPGKYAFFTIPGKETWTIIINKKWDQHLADDYSEAEDVLRIQVTPKEAGLRDRLDYRLDKINDTDLNFNFRWEKVSISFPIKIISPKPTYKMPKKATFIQTKNTHSVHAGSMAHAFSRDLPMNRNGSGTGWLPDETPMYAWMRHANGWNLMGHGAFFLRQNFQNVNNNYKRGGSQFDIPGWAMLMAQRKIKNNGLLLLRGMLTTDVLTMGGSGYPLLFQSGEAYNGQPLVDRQHPHELISELGVGYTQRIRPGFDISLYIGYPGEPSIGPTAFMHRVSSMNNPDAPLGHHWQDATHITFGVATLGVRYKKFKLEGSSFKGREPNENRYNFDAPRFDSYSYRLSFAPSKNWVIQASGAYLRSPEELEPDEDVKRSTASVIYSSSKNNNHMFTSALAWGLNQSDHQEHSILWEGNYQMKRVALHSRFESFQKSNHELNIISLTDIIYSVQALTLGGTFRFAKWFNTDTAVGFQMTQNFIPDSLESFYGKQPLSMQVFIRVVPALFTSYN
jgi:hypothetical protein